MSTGPEQQDPPEADEKLRRAREELALQDQEQAREELRQYYEARGLRPLDPSEPIPEVSWLCEQSLTFEGSSLIHAKPKAGKSSLIQALAVGMASGRGAVPSLEGGWIFDAKGKRTRTLYIDTENSRGLVLRRLRSLAKEIGEDLPELISSGWIEVLTLESSNPAPFLKSEGRESIKDDEQQARTFGDILKRNGVRLIVCDVMSQCYQEEDSDRDELSQGFMRDFFKVINTLRSASGAHLLLVHHDKKGSGRGPEQASGSSQMLRTPETLMHLVSLAEEDNPDSDLFLLQITGRQLRRERLHWLKAGSSADGSCRVFKEVPKPEKEKRAKGAPATALNHAKELLEAVLRKDPQARGREIGPKDWLGLVGRVKETVPEWQKSDETLKTWLIHLVHAGLVEKVSSGIYRIH